MTSDDSEIANRLAAGRGRGEARAANYRQGARGMKTETAEGGMLEHWTTEEVAAARARDEIVLIDVRTIQEYAFEHIPGALLLPLPFFEAHALPGQESKRIVFLCGSGVRLERVARACLAAGIGRIAHLADGFAAWKAAKLPYVGTNMATGAPQPVNQ